MTTSALTDADLRRMRADVARLMPGTAVLLTLSQTPDGQGGFTDVWTAAGTVACRLDNAGGGRRNVAAAERTYSGWTLTVPYDTDLTTEHRVTVGSYTYSVMDVSDEPSWPVVVRARVERVE